MRTEARRRRRTTETTQLEILQAAEALFAEKGFADTSLSAIAERAQVTKSLIHHHFGSKEDLWSAVKRQHLEEYRTLREHLSRRDEGHVASIDAAIRAYYEFLSHRPRLVRIFGWMTLESLGGEYAEAGGGVIKLAASSFKEAQREGRLRPDLDPLFAVLTFVSATEHWLRVRDQLVPAILEIDAESADEWFVRNLVDLIRRGIESAQA